MLTSISITPREVIADEAILRKVYDGAKLGLSKERLAVFAGLLPVELNQLAELDGRVAIVELKGRTESEVIASQALHDAAAGGDVKAALAILQHKHDWTAKQEIVSTEYRVDIKELLKNREARLNLIKDVTPVLEDMQSSISMKVTSTITSIVADEMGAEMSGVEDD